MDAVIEVFSGTCSNLNSLICLNSSYDGENESTTIGGFNSRTKLLHTSIRLVQLDSKYNGFQACIETFDQCNIDPGINSNPENEACGENENGGCFVVNPTYQDVTCNESIFGSCWAENGIKDLDWYRFEIYEAGLSSFMISSEFPVTIDVFNISDYSIPQLVGSEL